MSFDLSETSVLCKLAYESPYSILQAYNGEGEEWVVDRVQALATSKPVYLCDPNTNAQGYIFPMDVGVAVAIRGTDTVVDVIKDICVDLVDVPQGKVHHGFRQQYDGLAKMVYDYCSVNSFDKIHLCGHSSGAAVAAQLALELCTEYPGKVSYTGFGCPRFCNVTYAKTFRTSLTERVTVKNGRDPVTKIVMGNDYSDLLETSFQYGRLDAYTKIPLLTDLTDHDIIKYVEAITGEDVPSDNPWEKFIRFLIGWTFDRMQSIR
jgi:predicted lipase